MIQAKGRQIKVSIMGLFACFREEFMFSICILRCILCMYYLEAFSLTWLLLLSRGKTSICLSVSLRIRNEKYNTFAAKKGIGNLRLKKGS